MTIAGWRGLALFWLAILAVAGAGAATLQAMGPVKAEAKFAVQPPAPAAPLARVAANPAAPGPPIPARKLGGAVADPDPFLLEPAPDWPGAQLPRVGADGRTPMQAYAPAVDPADTRPKVAVLLVGLGQSDAESRAAVETLPHGVTLGVSPYAPDTAALLADARSHGHELLVTLPMESQGYPLNDSGPHALLTGADPADNARNLEWVLSRVPGAAGVTGASDGLKGERYASSNVLFGPVLHELASRGLLYVDPRTGAAVTGAAVAVTSVVDDPPQRASIDAKLAVLEQAARDGKLALGLAGPLRPVTVDRIASWARGLDGRGINLVPVSALLPHGATQ